MKASSNATVIMHHHGPTLTKLGQRTSLPNETAFWVGRKLAKKVSLLLSTLLRAHMFFYASKRRKICFKCRTSSSRNNNWHAEKKSMFHIWKQRFYVHVRNWHELSDNPFRMIFCSRKSRFWSASQRSWRTKLLSQIKMNLPFKIEFGYEKCELKWS